MKLRYLFIGLVLCLFLVGTVSADAFSSWSAYGDAWKATNDTYVVIKWDSPGTYSFVTTGNATSVESLVIGGGGGAGATAGGGGGAGGYLTGTGLAVSGVETIIVGAGGAGGIEASTLGGSAGGNSSLTNDGATITATGGGGGLRYNLENANKNGGSGGGSAYTDQTPGTGVGGQGYAGGQGSSGGGGGGGGANEVGKTAAAGRKGGDGISNSITGSAVTYAGGGGGAPEGAGSNGAGGAGGGGGGGNPGVAGTDGLGGGGGGGSDISNERASGGHGGSGVVIIRYYSPVQAPLASFTSNITPDNGMVWSSFQFNDTSTNTPTMWNYSFLDAVGTKEWNNGTTVTARNLTKIFSTGGNYTVQLWAQNSGGGNYSAKQQYLDVWNWSPASFTGTPLLGANPLSVTFSGSSNNATDYYWQFGDSSTDTVQNPTHIYTADGTYNVNYRTKNAYHSGNWSNQSGYITVNVTLTSDFTGSPTVGYAPLDVAFVDMSTGDGLYYWEWDFGDTGTSLLRNPSHTYTTSGAFNVKLTAKGSDGTAVTTKNGYINVLYPFSKYTDPLGYILANGADNKIRFYDFKNATDGEYIEIIVSGSYEVP
jgi:PKD repeat protein